MARSSRCIVGGVGAGIGVRVLGLGNVQPFVIGRLPPHFGRPLLRRPLHGLVFFGGRHALCTLLKVPIHSIGWRLMNANRLDAGRHSGWSALPFGWSLFLRVLPARSSSPDVDLSHTPVDNITASYRVTAAAVKLGRRAAAAACRETTAAPPGRSLARPWSSPRQPCRVPHPLTKLNDVIRLQTPQE